MVDNLTIYEYNLDKIKRDCLNGSKEYVDIALLDCSKEELDSLIKKGDKYMEEFKDNVEVLNENPEFVEFLSVQQDEKMTINSIKEDEFEKGQVAGRKEATLERNLEIARNLLSKNMDIDFIVETTGLSKKEVLALKS